MGLRDGIVRAGGSTVGEEEENDDMTAAGMCGQPEYMGAGVQS